MPAYVHNTSQKWAEKTPAYKKNAICKNLSIDSIEEKRGWSGWVFRNFNVRHRQIKRLLHLLVKNDGMNVLGSHLGNLNRSRGKMTQFQ